MTVSERVPIGFGFFVWFWVLSQAACLCPKMRLCASSIETSIAPEKDRFSFLAICLPRLMVFMLRMTFLRIRSVLIFNVVKNYTLYTYRVNRFLLKSFILRLLTRY